MLINTHELGGTAHGSSAPRDRSACLFRGRARLICRLLYCRVGTCSFASAVQNIRKEDLIKIGRPHSSPGLELARGSIA